MLNHSRWESSSPLCCAGMEVCAPPSFPWEHMISRVSSDIAISPQAAGPLSLVFPEKDLSSFPTDMGKAVAIALPHLQPPGAWHRAVCFCEELLNSSCSFPHSELACGAVPVGPALLLC